jgi:hypothetical protein
LFFRLSAQTGRYAAATDDGQADWGVIEWRSWQWVRPDRRYLSCTAALAAATAFADDETVPLRAAPLSARSSQASVFTSSNAATAW